MSPYSPLNKSTFKGHKIDLPEGYNVQNSTENSMIISNGTTTIKIYSQDISTVNQAIKKYKNKYSDQFNVTEAKIKLDNGKSIIKTKAQQINGTVTVYKYWFEKDGKVLNMQTGDSSKETEAIIKTMISSM